jgi:O-antigen ligase
MVDVKTILFAFLFFINLSVKIPFKFLEIPSYRISLLYVLVILSIVICSFFKKYLLPIYTIIFILLIYLFFNSLLIGNFSYGFEKLTLGLMFPLAIFNLLIFTNMSTNSIINGLICSSLIIAVTAIVFKLYFGFFTRGVSFGFLGPITFSWINGFSFIALLFKKVKKNIDQFLMFFFFLMIIWSGSKGPIIAILVLMILNLKFFIPLGANKKLKYFIALSCFFIFLFLLKDYVRSLNGLYDIIVSPKEYIENQGKGSVGIRIDLYKQAFFLFVEKPFFGHGFGSWADISNTKFKYPHNIVLELMAETGFIGLLFFTLIIFLGRGNNLQLNAISLFGVIALLFSGDFSYFRYVLLFLLFSFKYKFSKNELYI